MRTSLENSFTTLYPLFQITCSHYFYNVLKCVNKQTTTIKMFVQDLQKEFYNVIKSDRVLIFGMYVFLHDIFGVFTIMIYLKIS